MRSSYDDSNWWGGHGWSDNRLSLLDLKLAALLWLLVEKKSSIIVAAAPQLAGKTTLLTALIDFMPPWFERVYTQDQDEDFLFLDTTFPENTYIMVPELSDHTQAYLWGDAVRMLFQALERGYSMAATMHADTPEEVIDMLQGDPVNVPRDLLHHLHVIVNLQLVYGQGVMVRRVSLLTTLLAPGPNAYDPVLLPPLARWDPDTDTFVHVGSPEARAMLSMRLMLGSKEVETDLTRRTETLEAWLKRGPISASELRNLVVQYYGEGPSRF